MMKNFIINFAQRIGVDKSIAYSSGSRVLQGAAGVISVFFITSFLSGVEQGFYYTFGSILALQVFFELGLTGIMTQYVAHEASHLQLNEMNVYEGEVKYKSRLASLIQFCLKWYIVLAFIVFAFLLVVGYVFFYHYSKEQTDVSWEIPWIIICFGTSINVFLAPFSSILMGLGKVKEMTKIGFIQQILIPLVTWTGFVSGLKLYIIGISSIFGTIVWLIYVWKSGLLKIIFNLFETNVTERVSYFTDIFPYQWKIALSWVSGYFIFQLFNPVLFATEGAVVAGQMGMTLQALNSIQSLAMSWLNTKIPLYSQLIALKDYLSLDRIFFRTLRQMTTVCALLLLCFFLVVWGLNVSHLTIRGNIVADRFLGSFPMALLMVTVYLQQYTNSWASYLRCHLKEPFLILSICGGIATGVSTIVFGNLYGLYGVTIGYFVLTIILFPWGYYLFMKKKKEWHHE